MDLPDVRHWTETKRDYQKKRIAVISKFINERSQLHKRELESLLQEECRWDTLVLNDPSYKRDAELALSRIEEQRRRLNLSFWREVTELRRQIYETASERSNVNLYRK